MYPAEVLDPESDDGTMPNNVAALSDAVIGHKIVKVEKAEIEGRYGFPQMGTVITLDNGDQVQLVDTSDCCAFTELNNFLLHPDKVDHIIVGVGTSEYYTTWHVYADAGDVLQLEVGWSCGNPFYYGYGFDINVKEAPLVIPKFNTVEEVEAWLDTRNHDGHKHPHYGQGEDSITDR